jgi:hypothetical protein
VSFFSTTNPHNDKLCVFLAGEVVNGPVSQVVLLSEYAVFNCETHNSPPQWVINGSIFSSAMESRRGIKLGLQSQLGSSGYRSALKVYAQALNNNTEIQCTVFTGDSISEPALLKIQGITTSIVLVMFWSRPLSCFG